MAEVVGYASDLVGSDETRELWFAGDLSKRTPREIDSLRWAVRSNVAQTMKTDPVDQTETDEES